MRGLIYRNFQLMKASLILFFFMSALVLILPQLLFGILADEIVEGGAMMGSAVAMMVFFMALFSTTVCSSELFIAENTKLKNSFYMSLPGSADQYIQSRYYTIMILHLVLLLIVYISNIQITILVEEVASWFDIAAILIAINLWLIAIEIPLTIFFYDKLGANTRVILLALLFVVLFPYFLFGDISFIVNADGSIVQGFYNLFSKTETYIGIFTAILLSAPIALILSCKLSIYLFRRKLNEE